MGRIVVGVDGSANARAALDWALGQARVTESTVVAVMVWRDPYAVADGWTGTIAQYADTDELERQHRDELDDIVDAANSEGLQAPVERVVASGNAASTLLEFAHDADLVVVGSRGHGGFVGLLLGSVSQQVANHAACPVVIVPSPPGARS